MPECSIQTTETNSVKEQYREHVTPENNVNTDNNGGVINCEIQKRERLRRAIARRTRVRQEQYAPPHWGVVAEPYMCSWHALNLMMHHLHEPLISEEELTNAVEEVNAFLNKLTQHSQPMRQTSQMESANKKKKRHSRMYSHNHKESESDDTYTSSSFTPDKKNNNLLSSQPFTSMMEYMSQSSQAMTQSHLFRRPAVLMTDLQDALLLEVLNKILCNRRNSNNSDSEESMHSAERGSKLTFTRIGRREWRARNGRLSPIDLIPFKKCFVVADRSDPSTFVIFVALPRPQPHSQQLHSFCAIQEENPSSSPYSSYQQEEEEECNLHYNEECNKTKNDTKASLPKISDILHLPVHTDNSTKGKAENHHYVQIIAVSNTPVPWRRLVRKRLPYISLRDCAIAVIERIDNDIVSNNDKANKNKLKKQKQSKPNVNYSQSQEIPLIQNVQGHNTNDINYDCKHKMSTSRCTSSYSHTIPHYSEKNFNFCAPEPLFSASLEITHDPLNLLPIVELGNLTQRRGRRGIRRSWVERLFLSNTSDRAAALRKLYSYNNSVDDTDTNIHITEVSRNRTESTMRNDINNHDDDDDDDDDDYPF